MRWRGAGTVFLSTPSARRATRRGFFERFQMIISIHALREEGDQPCESVRGGSVQFLSTPSARRATSRPVHRCGHTHISIHALREEGDQRSSRSCVSSSNFYPRPPRGGRRWICSTLSPMNNFYPRPPRGGRRCRPSARWCRLHYFYPRPPRGGRRQVAKMSFRG